MVNKKVINNPFKGGLQYISEGSGIGGKYGLNIETLSSDRTLIPGTDYIYQRYHPNGANRIITLDQANATIGDRFIIINRAIGSQTPYLEIKQDTTSLDRIYSKGVKEFIYDDGTYGWISAEVGTGEGIENYTSVGIGRNAIAYECAAALGYGTDAHLDGVAVGSFALGYNYGIGIGYQADGHDRGVAIGDNCHGETNGIAIGQSCNSNDLRSIALGFRSKNTRDREVAINIGDEVEDDMEDKLQQIVIGSWVRKTTDATPTTMYVDGDNASRFTIRPQSALIFKLMVTARDNTSGDCAGYLFDGLIKRDGANNTTLCVCNKTMLHEDDDTWDCEIAAAGTRIVITVTGDADNLVRWASRLDGVETSFVAA